MWNDVSVNNLVQFVDYKTNVTDVKLMLCDGLTSLTWMLETGIA